MQQSGQQRRNLDQFPPPPLPPLILQELKRSFFLAVLCSL